MDDNDGEAEQAGGSEEARGERDGRGAELDDEDEELFDISLPATHSYMGGSLEAVGGRLVLEAGWEGAVPCVAHHGAVFPGETVPMLLPRHRDAELLLKAINHDKLFGLLCPDESGTMVSGYGVLCEVFEAAVPRGDDDERRGSLAALTFKARATWRFRLVGGRGGLPLAALSRARPLRVRVLADTRGTWPPHAAALHSLDLYRNTPTTRGLVRRAEAALTAWPRFVYDIFDYERIRAAIQDYFRTQTHGPLPEEPIALSFWVASNLALSPRDRLALLAVDAALLRLHMELRLISKKCVLCCASCLSEVARREDMFAMSSEGVHSNFTNLGGYMHDLMTVSAVRNVELSGSPSAEFSWFPGYTWTIAVCATCMAHLGWRFDAARARLRPARFYGLCRNYVQPRGDRAPAPADSDTDEDPAALPAPPAPPAHRRQLQPPLPD